MKQVALLLMLISFFSCSKCQTKYLGYTVPQPELGTIFSSNLSSGASFTRTGSSGTWSYNISGLSISGSGTNAPDNFIEYPWYTNLENNETGVSFTPTADGNGIGVGYVGSNGRYYYGRIILTGSEKGQLRFDAVQSGIVTNRVNSGSNYFNVENGQQYTLNLKRTQDTIFLTVRNTASLDSQVLKYPLNYSTALNFDSYKTGRMGIFWLGGDQTVTNFYYKSDIKKNPKLLITGDSNMQGAFAGTASSRYGSILDSSTTDRVIIVAGAGNFSGDIINLLPEILLINPVAVMVNIGTNGITEANINTIVSTLSSAGIKVYLMTIFPTVNGVNLSGNAIIRAKTGVTLIDMDATLLNGGSSLYPGYDHDGLHLNAAGNRAVYDKLKTEFATLLR